MGMLLLYGATGYTGELVARTAVAQNVSPVLAGRTEQTVTGKAEALNLPYRIFSLDDPGAVDAALADVDVVLNCAGPFSITAEPLIDACLRTNAHYLDIAGEVPEFEAAAARDADAQEAGTMLLPGAGFGVVPTDCLALCLKQQLPSATYLTLAFQTIGGVSRGTLTTLLSDLFTNGVIRRDGTLRTAAPAAHHLHVEFGDGAVHTVTNPWRGDLVTAYHSTGIPNIETFMAFPAPIRWLMMARPLMRGVWESSVVQRALTALIRRLPAGPSASDLADGETHVWGEVRDAAGTTVAARLHGPEAYAFTAQTAVAIAARVLAGDVTAGFQTPASAYGADFVLDIKGVTREDL